MIFSVRKKMKPKTLENKNINLREGMKNGILHQMWY